MLHSLTYLLGLLTADMCSIEKLKGSTTCISLPSASQQYAIDVVMWGIMIHHASPLHTYFKGVWHHWSPPVKSQQHLQMAPGKVTISVADNHC